MEETEKTMSTRKLKLGLVGCGEHSSEIIIPALQSVKNLIDVVAVCDSDPAAASAAANSLGGITHSKDYLSLLSIKDLDAVAVVGPPQLHFTVAGMALERGLHVFVEKPPAITMRDVEQLARLAKDRNLVTCVGHNLRHSQLATQLQRVVRNERAVTLGPPFGEAVAMEMRYFASKPRGDRWGLGSPLRSFLLSHVNHAVDFMIHQMGAIKEVSAAIASTKEQGIALSAHLKFETKAVGTLFATSSAPKFTVAGTIVTKDHKVARFDSLRHIEVEVGDSETTDKSWRTIWSPKTLLVGYDHAGYSTELECFARAALTGKPAACHPSFLDEVSIYRTIDEIEHFVSSSNTEETEHFNPSDSGSWRKL